MSKFPCYGCPDIGSDVPRCNNWDKCEKYRTWLRDQGIKGVAIYVACKIIERRKSANKKIKEETSRGEIYANDPEGWGQIKAEMEANPND